MFRFAVSGSNFEIISYILDEIREYTDKVTNYCFRSLRHGLSFHTFVPINDEMIKYVKSISGELVKYVNICNYLCQNI